VQLGEVRHAGQRRQVRPKGQHRRGRLVGLVVAPELDQRVDLDRVRDRRSRRHVDGVPRGRERRREIVLAELERADPDDNERVIRRQLARAVERCFRGRVQRWIGRLADALEEGKPEVALGRGVGRVRVDRGLQPVNVVERRGAGWRRRRRGWNGHGRRRRRRTRGVRRPRRDRATSHCGERERGDGKDELEATTKRGSHTGDAQPAGRWFTRSAKHAVVTLP
jgi:hypothetical protein